MDIFELDNETPDENSCEMIESLQNANHKLQQEIERLKGENLDMRNSLKSIHDTDLPLMDKLADLARVHRFTLLRKDLERLLELPKEPELSITIDPEVFGKTVVVGGYRKP